MSDDAQISFSDVGVIDGDDSSPKPTAAHPDTAARLAPPATRVVSGAPGRGAIPAGAPPPGPFNATGGPATASVPMPPTVPAPKIAAARPFPAAPPPQATSTPAPTPTTLRSDEADEKRIDRLCDVVCERLRDRGESTAKSILEQFAAQGGQRFVERLSDTIATQAVHALRPKRVRQVVAAAAGAFVIFGVAIGLPIGMLLANIGVHGTSPIAGDRVTQQAVTSFTTHNDASVFSKIAGCDPSFGLIRRTGRDGRLRCAGSTGARYGWIPLSDP